MDKEDDFSSARCDQSESNGGDVTSSFFSSLELQSRYPIYNKIEGIESNGEVYANDEDYDTSAPPRTHTGGKWKPGSRPNVHSNGYWRGKDVNAPNAPPRATRRSKRAKWKGLPDGFAKKSTPTGNPTPCPFCNDGFKSKSSLLEHCISKHEGGVRKCPSCKFQCVFGDEMTEHRAAKHKGNASHVCDRCDYASDRRGDLLFHKTSHQQPVLDKYRCPVCEKMLRMTSMRQHIYKHTGDKHYECKICNRQFIQRGSLLYHAQTHSDEAGYSCEECQYSTKIRSTFKKHLLIHTERERPFECEECGSKHLNKAALIRHKKTHVRPKDRPLKCPEKDCGRAFVSKTDFAYHMRVHRDERPFECEACDYKGKTAHQLLKHKRSHTGEKPFKCLYCPYTTAYSTHLTRHLLIHSGDKPYTCPYCPFRCNSIENIRKHILSTKKHRGKSVYQCKFCDRSFNECAEFKSHLTAEHKDEFPDDNVDVGSVIAGLYDRIKVNKVIPNPISYTPKKEIRNGKTSSPPDSSVKKIRRTAKKRRKTDGNLLKPADALVDVKTRHDDVTTLPCLPSSSDQLVSAADKQKIACSAVDDFSSSSLISVAIDNQVIGSEALSLDQVGLMQLVTLNIPDLAGQGELTTADENPVFIYV